jgi:hypothetical protein
MSPPPELVGFFFVALVVMIVFRLITGKWPDTPTCSRCGGSGFKYGRKCTWC